MQTSSFRLRENISRIFMTSVSIAGSLLILTHLMNVEVPHNPIILLLFSVYIIICEYFPIPVWKGNTTLTFPIIVTLYLLYGLSWTIVIYGLAVLLVNILSRRPLRIVLFNPTTLVLSFFIGVKVMESLDFYIHYDSLVLDSFVSYSILLIVFIIVNNLMVDIVLWLRPQTYFGKAWMQKNIVEGYSAIISLVYGFMVFLLGNERKEVLDFYSFFFFFSPLVGFSLLSAVITRLRKEKNRLKALFSVTTDLNKLVPTNRFISIMDSSFQKLIDVDAEMLWLKENDSWEVQHINGMVQSTEPLSSELIQLVNTVTKPVLIDNRRNDIGIADAYFDYDLKSFIYAPLVIENGQVGMLIVGRSRTKSFSEDDLSSVATFANQLAIAVKTQSLIKEKEKRLLLEERNRIAREIHDGIAQSLAGAIMNLETAERKFPHHPNETIQIVSDSTKKLRDSLKEIRQSIYALRPYPTEQVGLVPAMKNVIQSLEKEGGLDIRFEIRGKEVSLSSVVEKLLFEVFQEGMANSVKHSRTKRIDVLLGYQSEQILLKIKDYGIGFSLIEEVIRAKSTPHFGILNMNESVEKVNGSLQIDSKDGEGTEITIIVPIANLGRGKEYDSSFVS
ncbi:GAF domain-containing sensor histidine kinase [Ornithinibacillus californiensis]|uniref:GAF domain-containing sensor histidine kinase n=1 Tax=Ornithinibacillus californiensis TaxID=161536 RepID=UPI00064DDB7D|nr:GAF domain-containing sensor histidine kinase [Ornithinibacillus californiensis]